MRQPGCRRSTAKRGRVKKIREEARDCSSSVMDGWKMELGIRRKKKRRTRRKGFGNERICAVPYIVSVFNAVRVLCKTGMRIIYNDFSSARCTSKRA